MDIYWYAFLILTHVLTKDNKIIEFYWKSTVGEIVRMEEIHQRKEPNQATIVN